jgi:hypothetical protein
MGNRPEGIRENEEKKMKMMMISSKVSMTVMTVQFTSKPTS